MERLRRTLPPLDPLVAFEAAARLGSFTRAAEELALSQAAISQRIRLLEEHFGTPLFVRAHRRVRLTAAGRSLQHAASPALRQLALASEEVRARRGQARLSIGADQSIAAMWLMPRLDAFRAAFRARAGGEISVRVIASDVDEDCLADDIELAILHGAGGWPGREAGLLFAEEVFPVCAPSYLAGAPPLATAADLPDHALLELDDIHWDWMNWRGWLSRAGIHRAAGHEPLRMNAYPLIVEVARAGQGVALGWAQLVDPYLADGSLVRPLAESAVTEFGYYAVWPASGEPDPLAAAFRDFLLEEAAALTAPSPSASAG